MNELPTIDKVILCLSPNWIIPEFREYFDLWKNINKLILRTVYNKSFAELLTK